MGHYSQWFGISENIIVLPQKDSDALRVQAILERAAAGYLFECDVPWLLKQIKDYQQIASEYDARIQHLQAQLYQVPLE